MRYDYVLTYTILSGGVSLFAFPDTLQAAAAAPAAPAATLKGMSIKAEQALGLGVSAHYLLTNIQCAILSIALKAPSLKLLIPGYNTCTRARLVAGTAPKTGGSRHAGFSSHLSCRTRGAGGPHHKQSAQQTKACCVTLTLGKGTKSVSEFVGQFCFIADFVDALSVWCSVQVTG